MLKQTKKEQLQLLAEELITNKQGLEFIETELQGMTNHTWMPEHHDTYRHLNKKLHIQGVYWSGNDYMDILIKNETENNGLEIVVNLKFQFDQVEDITKEDLETTMNYEVTFKDNENKVNFWINKDLLKL